MSKLIIENNSSKSDADAIYLVSNVISIGKVFHGGSYCRFATF